MITLREVLQSIDELEDAPHDWDTAQRLAVMLALRDHLGGGADPASRSAPGLPAVSPDSEFLQLAMGKDQAAVWLVLDEMMDTLAVMMPRMYEGVLRRLREI